MVKSINKFIGVVPARGGSKRLPNKNLKLINNIPLTELSIIESIKSRLLSDLILSSNSDEILNLGKEIFLEHGGESFTLIPCINHDNRWAQCPNELITATSSQSLPL